MEKQTPDKIECPKFMMEPTDLDVCQCCVNPCLEFLASKGANKALGHTSEPKDQASAASSHLLSSA